ncbi:bifunctional hydroxymethylpyrimidine kinase/phosphomethylpyrimidine kinase [Brevirhabdus pacifica]|uniref:hydroxymethylpyrimidine kinase n=1 Tax=Brevirhabdus pacifica TaxID=1267768 RepID=A0A1U7DLB5_9RHOB|nr:bifunctional hydroxymethylpyrimidine kinase/phosphomethylpyrimidine kinase [Brevirhabdus pacifica]APX90772.1 bifunctional hydroxymethylpyrimidine kinase/phosphomethylpyrimidine kinase [Brevirhabdus pacifica]OWU79558.1 hydroxymethylpyrimidine kinase [Loktanella sp. 22II-4b]PJJ87349.1 hydroxymethylpyrimidine kinase /phosphomethylpyrimidine kinase [Brevirhabdus pacifica]
MTATALTIAGSDSGGGAGIQADLKTFSALGVYGASVITAVTAQNTQAVTAVHAIPEDVVTAQVDAVLSDIRIDAIKIGMLGTASLVRTVARALADYSGPVVLDPVMVAKSGDKLLADAAVDSLRTELLPRADLLTPNLPEAAHLLGYDEAADTQEMERQGRALLDLGARGVLMKGGHASGEICVDLLILPDQPALRLTAPRIDTRNTHGTGCTLSSAIAARLALGDALPEAVSAAHGYLQGAIRAADALGIGKGHGPTHHFHERWTA